MKRFITLMLVLLVSVVVSAQSVSIDNKKVVDGEKVLIEGAWLDAGTYANALTIALKSFTLKEGEFATITAGTISIKVSHPQGAYVAAFPSGSKAYATVTQLRAAIKEAVT